MEKNQSLLLLLFVVFVTSSSSFAQGFTAPKENNAVIYFVRVTNWGKMSSFEFFHNQKFISVFKGKNYIRYECPAGKQLFWASSEDKEFLNCDLEAGRTYMVLVNVEMGAWKARVGLEPLTLENEDFERVKELVQKKKPILTSESKIEKTQKKLDKRGFVENIMFRYEDEWKDAKNTKIISRDMYIPKENL